MGFSMLTVQFQKKIHTHAMEGHWKFIGGGEGGSLKSKFEKQGMKVNWTFLGEGRRWVQNKKPSIGGSIGGGGEDGYFL